MTSLRGNVRAKGEELEKMEAKMVEQDAEFSQALWTVMRDPAAAQRLTVEFVVERRACEDAKAAASDALSVLAEKERAIVERETSLLERERVNHEHVLVAEKLVEFMAGECRSIPQRLEAAERLLEAMK